MEEDAEKGVEEGAEEGAHGAASSPPITTSLASLARPPTKLTAAGTWPRPSGACVESAWKSE